MHHNQKSPTWGVKATAEGQGDFMPCFYGSFAG
jgi:hypothetical protein